MRKRTTLILVAVVAAGIAGCGGGTVEEGCSPMKEIATSAVSKDGDVWKVAITSNIEAPVDQVLEAASHPERGHDLVPESILKSEIVTDAADKKLVDIVARLDVLPPGFKVQNIKTEYTYYPQEKKFRTKSIDFNLADLDSEYVFEPSADGKGTVLKYTQTSKTKSAMIVESLQKGALCETFVIQVRVLRRALGLDPKPAA